MRYFNILLLVTLAAGLLTGGGDDEMTQKRLEMVETQIAGRGIRDVRVLDAMRRVERHRFVPDEVLSHAYGDHPLRIGYDQTISQPYVVALMTEAIAPEAGDRILEIGTGSGYQAAVLSLLVDTVYTIEIVPELGRDAAQRLRTLGYTNVDVRIGDGYKGWPEEAPFDGIIVTAAPPQVPQALIDQLADGGRMVVPVGTSIQDLMLLEKKDGRVKRHNLTGVRFVPMVHGEERAPEGE